MYQKIGEAAYKVNLSNIVLLTEYLGNPQVKIKTIHVGGTNGKGSTSHMLASVLQEAGYKVGLYTSPHLKDFRERIKIQGEMISKREVSSFITKHKTFFEENHMSFFEMTVGLAFTTFAKHKVDIAIIEVGLGGRLDSTNIIKPEISVISNIGLDHTQFLGDTHTAIAKEKAGIIKMGTPVIIGETRADTKQVFLETAKMLKAPIYFAEDFNRVHYICDLKGEYQIKNQQTALVAIQQLIKIGYTISEASIQSGLANVIANTGLLGRWQLLKEKPRVICDTAHNKEGLLIVLHQLKGMSFNNLHIVIGVVKDKNLAAILPLFPENAHYYFCQPKIPRAMEVSQLAGLAKKYNLKGYTYKTVKGAYRSALRKAEKNDIIYIGGSTFVVAEVV